MRIRLQRTYQDDHKTLGELTLYGDNGYLLFVCYTVENPWLDNEPYVSCIPAGAYEGFRRLSPSNGEVVELKDVPGRTFIQFHVANTADDLDGCIGVGYDRTTEGVLKSQLAMNRINELVKDTVSVEIVDKAVPDVRPPDIAFETVDATGFEKWEMSMPAEWIESVDEGKGLQRSKEIAEQALQRSAWKRRGVMALNAGISIVARVTQIPELNHLKLKTESNMKRIKPVLKRKTFWEGVAALLGGVGIAIYPDAIIEIVTGVFIIIGGVEMWKQETEEE